MSRRDSRAALLNVGERFLLTSGYAGTGLSEIMTAAGVPKGSFYHWFHSKRAYVGEVARQYYDRHDAVLRAWIDKPGPARERLVGYFNETRDHYAATLEPVSSPRKNPDPADAKVVLGDPANDKSALPVGCLLGALALEVADTEEELRVQVAGLFERWRSRLIELLEQAQADDTLADGLDVTTTAEVLLDAWEGALLRMRLARTVQPLDTFLSTTLTRLLRT